MRDYVSSRFRINKKGDKMSLKLSNQAVGSLMMALQKGLLEQIDITGILQGFKLMDTEDGLIIENPPILEVADSEKEEQVDA